MPLSGGTWWRRTDLEEAQQLSPKEDLAGRTEALERAFGAEVTSSMSLNVRATGLAGGSALAILLLAQFASTWLDDNRWALPDVFEFALKKVLLPGSIWALVICILLATMAAWPRRGWGGLQRERTRCLAAGQREREAQLLLEMLERQRANNERKGRLLRLASIPMAVAIALVVAQCMAFAFKANPVDPPRTDAPAAVEVDDTAGLPSKEDQARLAGLYAPMVWLHSSERWGPLDPLDFIEGSELVWHEPNGDSRVAGRGSVDPRRLGRACGTAPGGCYTHERYLASELTRPFHGGARRPRDLNRGRGFSLVPNRRAQEGQNGTRPLDGVPMLWDVRKTARELLITYWFYYGYSRPNAPAARVVGDVASHDGDWENIEVALTPDAQEPVAVYFYGHGAPSKVRWDDVEQGSGHPIVYSALSSHASYDKAGKRQVRGEKGIATDVTQAGRRWATWDQLGGLRRVRDEPWYGFGGAWGRAKDPDGTTGPLGPSQWKLPADPDPGDLRSGH